MSTSPSLLERCLHVLDKEISDNTPDQAKLIKDLDAAIAEQAEPQEPDLFVCFSENGQHIRYWTKVKDDAERFAIREGAAIVLFYTRPQALEQPPLVQIASDIMGACMNGDLSDKWEDVADCLVKNDFDGLSKLVALDPMSDDVKRYQWLKTRLLGADFDWNGEGKCVIVFDWPKDVGIGGNCDMNLDAAIEAHHNIGVKK